MPYSHRVLIVDDRAEDGEAIARRLWHEQIPNCFVQFDDDLLANIKKRFYGIRVIFQDIKLYPGSGIPGHADYGAAAATLDRLLEDNNGPWLLVAWSTWGEDPEQGEVYARQLFEYLAERLPEGKKPYKYMVFDKKPYTVDHDHGQVKGEEELAHVEKELMLSKIREFFASTESLDAVSRWERDLGSCASSVVNDLWGMCQHLAGAPENELAGLLLRLAKAQNGRVGDDISEPLYEILASLLSDKSAYIVLNEIILDVKIYSGSADKINTMIHWDAVAHRNVNAPGAVYHYPVKGAASGCFIEPTAETAKEFILANFIADNGDNGKSIKAATEDNSFDENINLVLLDATPPCDHDNEKAVWRKMVLGIRAMKNVTTDEYLKQIKNQPSLKQTPVFSFEGKEFSFIFSSRLVVTLPDKENVLDSLDYIGRLREQLLRDYVAWFGGMFTRPGIVRLK